MRKVVLAAMFAVLTLGFVGFANAEPPAPVKSVSVAKAIDVPLEYKTLFDSYRGWKSESESIDSYFANSLENWAIHALNEVGRNGIAAIRNWLFTRGEDRIRQLATGYKEDLVSMFGKQFNLRGMHVVFAQSFTGDTEALYHSWYDCAAKLKLWPDSSTSSDELIGERVLMWTNSWDDKEFKRMTMGGACDAEFGALSGHYGVDRLSADDIYAIGFLSRRYVANLRSSKFASAEFLRKLVHDIFDPDQK